MAESIPMADLYAEYDSLRKDLFDLADNMPDGGEFKRDIIERDRQIQDLRDGRDAKIKECHPDGNHFPPHQDCPLCQRVSQMWDAQALKKCLELGLEPTDENLLLCLEKWLSERNSSA